jgi:hypothetical protein
MWIHLNANIIFMAQWVVMPTLALIIVQVYWLKMVLLLHGMTAWLE